MDKGFLSTMQMKILISLAILMAMIAMGSYSALNYEKIEFLNPSPATISVSGEGEVLAVPDVGQFTFSVQAEADDATLAQEKSGTKINAILAYLKEQGIEDKDVKNTSYNLSPKWRWEEKVCATGSYCPREKVQDGFEVSQSVRVKVRDTDSAGAIISGVGERGATNISGLNFMIDDTDALQAEARELAIADAQEKAVVLANQLGVKIVRLANYSEGGNSYQPQYEMRAMATLEEADGFGGAEIPVGEESTTARVTLVYEVR